MLPMVLLSKMATTATPPASLPPLKMQQRLSDLRIQSLMSMAILEALPMATQMAMVTKATAMATLMASRMVMAIINLILTAQMVIIRTPTVITMPMDPTMVMAASRVTTMLPAIMVTTQEVVDIRAAAVVVSEEVDATAVVALLRKDASLDRVEAGLLVQTRYHSARINGLSMRIEDQVMIFIALWYRKLFQAADGDLISQTTLLSVSSRGARNSIPQSQVFSSSCSSQWSFTQFLPFLKRFPP